MSEHIQRQRCVSCREVITDGETAIGVTVGVAQHGQIDSKNTQWRHTSCWSPLPERESNAD